MISFTRMRASETRIFNRFRSVRSQVIHQMVKQIGLKNRFVECHIDIISAY